MASIPRIYTTGEFYHVYNRGNRKQSIFLSVYDRLRFLEHYRDYLKLHPLTNLAYSLMGNHFHFLVRQDAEGALSKLFSKLSTSHAKYFNKKYEQVGSLFQQGFHARRIQDESHLLHLTRYIHRNSIDFLGSTLRVEPETIIDQLLAYRWSSLPEYLAPETVVEPFCDVRLAYEMSGIESADQYCDFLRADVEHYQAIEAYTSRLDP